MRNTLHHIKQYKEMLSDVQSSLKPGGVLIIEESIPSENRKKKKDECKKKIEPKKVEKRIKQGGLLFTQKEKIGKSIFYRCVPK